MRKLIFILGLLLSLETTMALPPGASELIKRNKERLTIQSQVEGENKQKYIDLLKYFSELESNWEQKIALDSSVVPKSCENWHKILKFYFGSQNEIHVAKQVEELVGLPQLCSVKATPDFKHLAKMDFNDYEIKGLEKRSVEIRMLYIRSTLNLGLQKIVSNDVTLIFTKKILRFVGELCIQPALLSNLTSKDVQDIAVCLNEFLQLEEEALAEMQKDAFTKLPKNLSFKQDKEKYKSFVMSIDIFSKQHFRNLFKAKPELHKSVHTSFQQNTYETLESIRQTIDGLKDESTKMDLTTMLLVSLKDVSLQTSVSNMQDERFHAVAQSKDISKLYDRIFLGGSFAEVEGKLASWKQAVSQKESSRNTQETLKLTKELLLSINALTLKQQKMGDEYKLAEDSSYDPKLDSKLKALKDDLLKTLQKK